MAPYNKTEVEIIDRLTRLALALSNAATSRDPEKVKVINDAADAARDLREHAGLTREPEA